MNTLLPNPNNSRIRSEETAEKLVDCISEDCLKQKTYRAIAKHYKDTHSVNNLVLALQCNIPTCEWYCYQSLRCFIDHMKRMHGTITSVDSELTIIKVARKSNKHSGHCSQTRAKAVAEQTEREEAIRLENKERNQALKAAERVAKRKARVAAKNIVRISGTNTLGWWRNRLGNWGRKRVTNS